MALLAGGLSSIVLYASLGGTTYGWFSAPMLALLAAGVVLPVASWSPSAARASRSCRSGCSATRVQRRERDRLHHRPRAVRRRDLHPALPPGGEGREPDLVGPPAAAADGRLLVASIGSGQLITRYGRYKLFPILGTAPRRRRAAAPLAPRGRDEHARWPTSTCSCSASASASRCRSSSSPSRTPSTTRTSASPPRRHPLPLDGRHDRRAALRRDLREQARRSICWRGCRRRCWRRLPARLGPSQIDQLPPAVREPYIAAWAEALHPFFLIAAGITVAGFVLTWFLEERPLRDTVADQTLGDSFAAPKGRDLARRARDAAQHLARKQNRHLVYDHLTESAGVELAPAAAGCCCA